MNIEEKIEKYMNESKKKITDEHWVIVNTHSDTGMIIANKVEIKKIMKPSKNGPTINTIHKYGGDLSIRVEALKDKIEGMNGSQDVIDQLKESKSASIEDLKNDPLYKDVIDAKSEDEAQKAINKLISVRGSDAINLLKKALKEYSK